MNFLKVSEPVWPDCAALWQTIMHTTGGALWNALSLYVQSRVRGTSSSMGVLRAQSQDHGDEAEARGALGDDIITRSCTQSSLGLEASGPEHPCERVVLECQE